MFRSLAKLAMYMKHKEMVNLQISNLSVGNHIYHCLKSINCTYDKLSSSNEYSELSVLNNKVEFNHSCVPLFKEIQLTKSATKECLLNEIEKAKKHIVMFNLLNENNVFYHYKFGFLNLKASLQLLKEITTFHIQQIERIVVKKTINSRDKAKGLV